MLCLLLALNIDLKYYLQVRYVFCFDKMLLICKQTRGDHYSFKEGLKIRDYKVQDVTSR